jgi:hypothetical protein
MIIFRCECGRELQARAEDAGRKSKCPACGLVSIIPSQEAARTDEALDTQAERTNPYALQADAPARGRDDEARRRPDAVREDEAPRKRSRKRDRYRDDEDDDRSLRIEEPEGTSGKATTALVLGLLSFPCVFNVFTGLPAIIFGALALGEIGRSRGRRGGKGMAVTGIITGSLGIVMVPVFLILLLVPAVQKVRSAAERAQDQNNLKFMSIAMLNYHEAMGSFPQAAATRSQDGKPLLSWRVALLPYIEQGALYNQFKLDEPWDSPNNIRLLGMIPRFYLQPGQVPDGSGMTYYQVFVGPGTIFDNSFLPKKPPQSGLLERGIRVTEITDGTSNTILIAEGKNPVPWTKPEDLTFDPRLPLPPLGGQITGRFNVAMADGSIRSIDPKNVPESTLRAMITRNGGEVFNMP